MFWFFGLLILALSLQPLDYGQPNVRTWTAFYFQQSVSESSCYYVVNRPTIYTIYTAIFRITFSIHTNLLPSTLHTYDPWREMAGQSHKP